MSRNSMRWALVTAALLLPALAGAPLAPAQAAGDPPPSFVFLIVDDLDTISLDHLPGLLERVAGQGVRFTNGFTSTPLCCPSRVSMLRGQYTHNHEIVTNFDAVQSCFENFRDLGHERDTLATWLQSAGYRTAMIGKYLNRYPGTAAGANPRHVAPGWDEWFVPLFTGRSEYFDYSVNANGEVIEYGDADADYFTDVIASRAADFIRSAGDRPLFVQLNPTAPHRPATPPHRHGSAFEGLQPPRTPSFNEEDVSDKVRWIQENMPLLTDRDIEVMDELFRARLRTMLAVEEMVDTIDDALRETGRLENTYLIFASDHGFHLGHHRFPQGKDTPFEPSIRIPMMMRGPLVPVAETREHMVLNVDLPATILELAGVPRPSIVDGRSLVPLLRDGSIPVEAWRREILLEHPPVPDIPEGLPGWWGVRTLDATYAEYVTNEREYYDLRSDPDQLESLHRRVDPALLAELSRRLAELRRCAGAGCN